MEDFNKVLEDFLNQTLESVKETIRLIKASSKLNTQSSINFLDELNKLSVEF